MDLNCDVIIAEFVWGPMKCPEPAVAQTTTEFGNKKVCVKHCSGARKSGYRLTALIK